MADDRLIVALDVATMEQLKNLVTTLGDSVSYYKVGMELFYAAGAETVTYLQEQGKSVFLDLKLHDIPNTVAQGVTSRYSLRCQAHHLAQPRRTRYDGGSRQSSYRSS